MCSVFSLHREGMGPSAAVRGLKWEPCKLNGLCLPTAFEITHLALSFKEVNSVPHCHQMKLHLTCNRVPEPVSHWLDKQVVPPSNSHHWMSQCRDRLTKNENIYSPSCHFKPLWCSLKHKRKYFEKCLSTFCRFERLWNSLEEEKLHTFLKISSFAKDHHTGLKRHTFVQNIP